MVDVVSEKNEVLSQISKVAAHEQGLLHRCVVAELIDSKGNWILVKQADDRQDAGQYVSPVGGHIQAGESEQAALEREAFEELGLTSFNSKRIGQVIYYREVIGRKENHLFVLFEIYSDQTPQLNHESVGFQTFTREQLRKELVENPKKFGDSFHFVMNTFYSS